MALPPIDELMAMTDQQKKDLHARELEELLESVDPERRKRLEAMQWKIDIKMSHAPTQWAGMLEVYEEMLHSHDELWGTWNGKEPVKTKGTVHTLKEFGK